MKESRIREKGPPSYRLVLLRRRISIRPAAGEVLGFGIGVRADSPLYQLSVFKEFGFKIRLIEFTDLYCNHGFFLWKRERLAPCDASVSDVANILASWNPSTVDFESHDFPETDDFELIHWAATVDTDNRIELHESTA